MVRNDLSTVSFNQMAKAGFLPECIYCDKNFPNASNIRVHLKLHGGIRPYKCKLCDYRAWYKTQVTTAHFLNLHGRRGLDSDVITNIEEEKALDKQTERESREIRENQVKAYKGEKIPPKKKPGREPRQVNHDYLLSRYNESSYQNDPNYEVPERDEQNDQNVEQNNNTPPKAPLSAKLSEAYNNNQKQLPNPSTANNFSTNQNGIQQIPTATQTQYQSNNVPNGTYEMPPPSQSQHQPNSIQNGSYQMSPPPQTHNQHNSIPNGFQELSMDQLLNNDF